MQILQIIGTSKKLHFWQNREKVLNWLNSASWAELHKGHMQESQGEVTYKIHVQESRRRVRVQGTCKLPKVICIYKWTDVLIVRTFPKSNVGVI